MEVEVYMKVGGGMDGMEVCIEVWTEVWMEVYIEVWMQYNWTRERNL